MDKSLAERSARALLAVHGLDPNLFKWNRGKNMMGQMRGTHDRRTGEITIDSIELSAYWVEAMTEDEVREVMLHEIAHAHVPLDNHGFRFMAKVREIGGTATRHCYSPSAETKARMQALAPPAWVGSCRKGHTTTQHRAPLRVRSCGRCSSSWDINNVIVWTKNGRSVPMPAKYTAELNRVRMRSIKAALRS